MLRSWKVKWIDQEYKYLGWDWKFYNEILKTRLLTKRNGI